MENISVQITSPDRKCFRCESKVSPDMNFCPHCGESMLVVKSYEKPEVNKMDKYCVGCPSGSNDAGVFNCAHDFPPMPCPKRPPGLTGDKIFHSHFYEGDFTNSDGWSAKVFFKEHKDYILFLNWWKLAQLPEDRETVPPEQMFACPQHPTLMVTKAEAKGFGNSCMACRRQLRPVPMLEKEHKEKQITKDDFGACEFTVPGGETLYFQNLTRDAICGSCGKRKDLAFYGKNWVCEECWKPPAGPKKIKPMPQVGPDDATIFKQ